MTGKNEIIAGLASVPRHEDDVAGVQDGAQFATFQGERGYQEDRFVIRRGLDVAARDAPLFLAQIFRDAAQATNRHLSGSTGTAAVLTQDGQLHAAFLGDSPVAVFVRDPATGGVAVQKLTRDHHARLPAEKKLVEAAGGRVHKNGRVSGSLMLSRAFGDAGIRGVLRLPEFASADLKKEMDAGKEVYILVSSDGLFEGDIKPADYIAPLKQALAEGKEDRLAEIFAAFAHQKGSTDNMTALVFNAPQKMDGALFLAIADGHGGGAASKKVAQVFAAGADARKPKP